jgi:hypothetical protein
MNRTIILGFLCIVVPLLGLYIISLCFNARDEFWYAWGWVVGLSTVIVEANLVAKLIKGEEN